MVRLRFLKVFDGATRPADEETIASLPESLSRSTSFEEFIHPFAVKELQWEQKALKEELYDSIFKAFSENGNLPPDQSPPAPAATTDDYEKRTAPEQEDLFPSQSGVTVENDPQAPEDISGVPTEEPSPVKGGLATIKASFLSASSKFHCNLLHKKSSSFFASVKTAFRRSKTSQSLTANPALTVASPVKESIEGQQPETTSNNSLEVSSTGAVCGTDEPADDATSALPEQHPRKASDQTILSEGSKTSSATVYRRPSRHISFGVDDSETDPSTQYVPGITYATLDSPKFAPLFAYSHPRPSHSPAHSLGGETCVFESCEYVPPAISFLPEYALPQRLFSDTELPSRQENALDAFNVLARLYGMYTLIRPENDPINYQCFIRHKPSKMETFLRKMRSVRSYIRFAPPSTQKGPTLRRVRTFSNLSAKYHTMNAIKGKPLEKLGRLWGYGALTLPGDFAPAVMRLPAFLVSLIDYLKTHGPNARNIFSEEGDLSLASDIYNHFADQIVSVEKEIDMDNLTGRRSDFLPKVLESYQFEEDSIRGRFHVLPVAWTFKNILAGLPGGILGAPRLYHTLVDIIHRQFPDEPVVPQFGYNGALPAVSPTRARVISLAILALTNDMQFDFLCAVFGLCSLLDYETHQLLDFYRTKHCPPISRAGLLTRDRIVDVFAPLLCEETKDVGPEDRGCEAYIVMEMMLDYWRTVSRQLHAFDM
ncbi:hypothetical protein UA08_06565 [Talaromyces atroroseus]|uniref:Rho-GAP domain-containing protein n=1 Tax=Talaromyces atroroseus TaxID=1441469 RepID=A0A225AB08_TALAT|nr:hypothetical protein UA08_06565 [Talaromyces atroroseus]OKL58102.1 hypothetical protein UA08_06565 [Talaromyces atroroseus]